jgi:hypothetical protein
LSKQASGDNEAQRDLYKQTEDKIKKENQIKIDEDHVDVSVQNTLNHNDLVKNRINEASNKLDDAYQLLDLAGWLVPIIAAIFYYTIFFYFKLPDVFTWVGLAIALPLFLFLRLVIWSLRIQLVGDDKSFVDSLKDTFYSFSEKHVKLKFDNTQLNDHISGLSRQAGSMLSTVRSYVPGLDQYYGAQERIRNQLFFIQKLRNALTEYGFPIREKSEQYLSKKFGPLTNSETEWLDEATKELALIYGVPSIFLKLIYADYLDDSTERKNDWAEIKKENKLLHAFAKVILRSGRIPTEYIEKDIESYGAIEELILKIDPFVLNDFLVIYNTYYYQFAEEKDALLNSLKFYRLNVSFELEDNIKRFVPSTFDDNGRLKSLLKFVSSVISIDNKVLELIFHEYQGMAAERQKAWTALKQKENMKTSEDPNPLLTYFVTLLIENGLLDIQYGSVDNQNLVHYFAKLLEPKEDFTISKARLDLLDSLRSLQRVKEDFLRTLSLNNMPLDDSEERNEFIQLLPTTDTFITLLSWLSSQIKVDETVLLLLFYDYTARVKKRDNCFEGFKNAKDKSARLKILANELLNKGIISYPSDSTESHEETVANLADYLAIAPKFERLKIDTMFSEYNRLFGYAKSVLVFLIEQRICDEKAEITFYGLLSAVDKSKGDILDKLQTVTTATLRSFRLLSLDDDWFEPVALSSIAVFLVVHEDMSLADIACRRYSSNSRIVKILYEYSWMNEKEQHKSQLDRTRFDDVIEIAIKGSASNDRYLSEFQRGLKSGFLYRRINDIPTVRLHHIQRQMAEVISQQDYATKLESHMQALGTVLESNLKSDTILESLKMQLVSAYAITFPTDADVISGIIDNLLLSVCEDFSNDDPIYRDIFIKAEIQEASIGKATRVGVVPYGMSFNDFSNYLQIAYKEAVTRYKESGNMRHDIDKYVANIVRIFPTATYFKKLEPVKESDEKEAGDSLAIMLRPLILRKFGAIRSAEILASLRTNVEEKIAMRSVLASLYDSSSALYLIAQKQFDVIISSPTLREYIKSGQFDGHLLHALESSSLSDLAVAMYRGAKEGVKQKEALKLRLKDKTEKTCNAIHSRPTEAEIQAVSELIFGILFDIGMVLDALK